MHEPMREFVEKFNRLIQRIHVASRPYGDNKNIFFVNVVPLDVSFHLIKEVVANFAATQRLAIQLEDALITTGKWRSQVQSSRSASTSTPIDRFMQRLMNVMSMLKRKQNRSNGPYQDINKCQQPQGHGKTHY